MALSYVRRAGSASGVTTVTSFNVPISTATTGGDLLIVTVGCCNVGDTNNVSSITDTKGNTYVSGGFTVDPGQNTLAAVWYCANSTALTTSDHLTVTLTSALLGFGQLWSASVDEASGAATSSVTDGSQGKNSQTGATWNTGTGVATTNANDLLWAGFCTNQGLPFALVNADSTPASGWNTLTQLSGGGNGAGAAYQVVSATGTDKGGGTATATNNGTSAVFVAFKAAAGGSTVNGSATLVGQGVLSALVDDAIGQGVLLDAPNVIIAQGLSLQGNSALAVNAHPLMGNGVLTVAPTLLLAPATAQANGALAVSATLLTAGDSTTGNGTLGESAQLLTSAILAANAAQAESARLLAPATLQGNGVLVATGFANAASLIGNGVLSVAARILAAVSLPAASVVNAAATLLANPSLPGSGAIGEAAVIDAGATLPGSGNLQASSTNNVFLVANAVLTATATVLSHASDQAAGVLDAAAQVLTHPSLVGNSILLAFKTVPPLSAVASLVQKLAAAFADVAKLAATFAAPVLKLSATFARSVSVANPNSTITVTMTVKDNTGALQSNLSAAAVTVTFPDGSTSSFTLAGGQVTNLGSGQYSITYTTKGIGECLEEWTFTAADGVTKGDFRNVTPVSY